MFDTKFWGEPISFYTDAEAITDGLLIDVSGLEIEFNNLPINRITAQAESVLKFQEKELSKAKNDLHFIADNSAKDGEEIDAWGIFEPHKDFGDEKLWLVANEIDGYTLMLPSDY